MCGARCLIGRGEASKGARCPRGRDVNWGEMSGSHYCHKIFIHLIQFLKWLIPPHIGLFETILQLAVSSLYSLYAYRAGRQC